MSSVCLVMIVKNEEARIGRCLRSALPHVDFAVICDTGSTDATVSIAESFLSSEGVDYVIRHDEWLDFGHNRTLAMEEAAGRADYLLLMDADMTLLVDDHLPDEPAQAFSIPILDAYDPHFVYRLPAVIDGQTPWKSIGATHEVLDPYVEPVLFDGWSLVHWMDGDRRPRKFDDDLRLLSAEADRDPLNPRTTFYLAETYRNLGMFDVAISVYEKRIEMGGGWAEEVYYSLFQIGCLKTAHWSFAEGAAALAECHRRFPHRAEPLRAMAYAATHIANRLPVAEGLFVDRGSYV